MIEIIHVSKKFRIWEDRSRDLKETTINLLKGKKRSFRDLWALRDIHLIIREGETVAFIGENGSGKSTLLKLLSGIYAPDEGKVNVRGRVASLLELGVGFHPDLTGEENVYLNGAMLGFDRAEMREKFEGIVSFSEIGDFIYSPIRTYSSGMLMRLGFSIATSVDPDVLFVDEILAVGDEAFQQKCLKRMETFKEEKKTIVLVSHAMETVEKFCQRAILLREGRVVCDDFSEKTVKAYHTMLYGEASGPDGAEGRKAAEACSGDVPSEEGSDLINPPAEGTASESSSAETWRVVFSEKTWFEVEKVKIIEAENSSFFAEDLFRRVFGHSPPQGPSNYVALYPGSGGPSMLQVVGFIHLERAGDMGMVGGVCVDPQWRGGGIGKRLLLSVDEKRKGEKAFFVRTDDSRLASACGYEALTHPYLLVKWLEPLSEEERSRLADAAIAFGPF